MTIVEITGGMLRAARSLTGLSQQEALTVPAVPPLNPQVGTSSPAIPRAMYTHLCRVVDVLAGEGVRFVGGLTLTMTRALGVSLKSRRIAGENGAYRY
jgi:hypothetical protein